MIIPSTADGHSTPSQSLRRICIATITRDRPTMLAQLLSSYVRMKMPVNISAHFLVVENKDASTLRNCIDAFREKIAPFPVHYCLEPILGIASARNHALEFALREQFDLLTFVDDDEEVDEDWLLNLLGERDAGDFDIVGSPVRLMAPRNTLSTWQRMIWNGLDETNRRSEMRAARLHETGRADTLRLATGSWMAKLDFFRATGLRFDSTLGLAGGEDWKLYAQARALGARTGWAPNAFAYETIPASRLTLTYYYRRSRDHTCMMMRQRFKDNGNMALLRACGSLLVRLFKIITALVTIPWRGPRSLLAGAYYLGGMVGIIRSFFGAVSQHYLAIDGY